MCFDLPSCKNASNTSGKRKLCYLTPLFVDGLCLGSLHFGLECRYRRRFDSTRENPSPAGVLWTATLAMHTRAAIGSASLVEAILATMRQFIGLAEDQQFALR